MTKQVISLSDQAANRIKEIMLSAENGSIGVSRLLIHLHRLAPQSSHPDLSIGQ